jgi:hypothetical protein
MKTRDTGLIFACLLIIAAIFVGISEPAMLMGIHYQSSAVSASLTVSPTLKDFGTVTSTATASQTFLFTASGLSLNPTVSFTGTNTTNFTYTHNFPEEMAPSSTAVMTVTFQPDATTGAKNATFTINY